MKKLLCIALILLLAGCTAKTSSAVDLMPRADPQTSALTLYIYDGETITRQHLFETDQYRADVMEDFHQAQAQEAAVDVTTLRPPFYGIEMGAGDYGTAYGLWADGYFIARNGKVYAFDYDFETFSTEHPWTEADEFSNLAIMPCADLAAKTSTGWNTAFLTEAEELVPPSGIVLEAVVGTDRVEAEFTNLSDTEWGYGCDFGLQVLLADRWYHVPAERNLCFESILYTLPAGQSAQQSYSLEPYGMLPPGTYRFVSQQMFAEFEVK